MKPLHIIILAAGQGKRMVSERPKVLHTLAGKSLIQRVLDTANQLNPAAIYIVHAADAEPLKQTIQQPAIHWVEQLTQQGTGHAVLQALEFIPNDAQVLVLCGDVPLISGDTLKALLAQSSELGLVTANRQNPHGYGRIVRNTENQITGIVEQKEANAEQANIKEINTGLISAHASLLQRYLPKLNADNSQQEYYLTDIFALVQSDGMTIDSIVCEQAHETQGVNTKNQLIALERQYQQLQAEQLLTAGVTIRDPARFDLRGELTVGQDVEIDIDVVIEGDVKLADGVVIESHVVLRNVTLGPGTRVRSHSVLEDCQAEANVIIGPFARIRPQTYLAEGARIGNFVEIKKSRIGPGSKIPHLSYVGDSELGANVNIGAGTITCNYDGAFKHKTQIGDHVFIGSGTQLVAPLEIGAGATIAAGSTVRKAVEPDSLTITQQLRQRSVPNWQRPVKKED